MKVILSNKIVIQQAPHVLQQKIKNLLTVENPIWLENERIGRWNKGVERTLTFYQITSDNEIVIPRGLMRYVIDLAREFKVTYQWIDRRRLLNEIDFSFHGELKPFQQQAVNRMFTKHFGILCAPTGSGKTIMGLWLIAKRKQPTLIIVHKKTLALQWIDNIQKHLNISGADIGLIGDGKYEVGKKITVAMVQSLYKHLDEIRYFFGYILVDECHRIPSRTFTDAVVNFDSYYMMGLTATPYRRDELSKLIFWYLGKMNYRIHDKLLVKRGDILKAEVIIRPTEFQFYQDASKNYSKLIELLINDKQRNKLIAEDITKEVNMNSGICLVLSDRKIHCETLHAYLLYNQGIASEMLIGSMTTQQRERVIERLTNNEVHVLIATSQLIGEGFDFPALSILFLSTPIRFSGRLLQYLGRILRPSPGKNIAKVYDYVDVHVPVLESAARSRQKVYSRTE
ncbi:MAG: DEAD/DEAH box helicase [Desulfobacterales bacterium]|nr:DEAD/DEAH box helicase [Desulfobacterales bacterium]